MEPSEPQLEFISVEPLQTQMTMEVVQTYQRVRTLRTSHYAAPFRKAPPRLSHQEQLERALDRTFDEYDVLLSFSSVEDQERRIPKHMYPLAELTRVDGLAKSHRQYPFELYFRSGSTDTQYLVLASSKEEQAQMGGRQSGDEATLAPP